MIRTLAIILSASLAACAAQAEVRYSGNASSPELITMESDPSVMVVANSEEPVFYSENTYWLYRDHRWYRSSSHRGGWHEADTLPEHVRRIDRPTRYVHVRPQPSAPRTTYNLPPPGPGGAGRRVIERPEREPERPQRDDDRAVDRAIDHTNDPGQREPLTPR
jgi:hypothetical protein